MTPVALQISCLMLCTPQMVPYKIVKANNGDAWVEVSAFEYACQACSVYGCLGLLTDAVG